MTTTTRTTTQPATLAIERAAGQRATFVVYYRRNGKNYLDGLYSADEAAARAEFEGLAEELGWRVEVDRVEARVQA